VDTLLVDHETVYAPRQSNDRLLLGLKGSLNEYELDLLRQRSAEARRAKAKRGELVITAPVGFVKTDDQRLEKDPDLRVQEAIRLVFTKFQQLGTARQVLLWFLEEDLQRGIPMETPHGGTDRHARPGVTPENCSALKIWLETPPPASTAVMVWRDRRTGNVRPEPPRSTIKLTTTDSNSPSSRPLNYGYEGGSLAAQRVNSC
jgi:hypothetical protein